jgi:nucleotide-binding universal stress UspA family protein
MTYTTLMVHVDVDSELGGRAHLAAGLADRLGAHLIGIAGWAPMAVFLAADAPTEPAVGDFHLQDMRTLLDQKGKQFCAAVDSGDRRAEWRSFLELPTEAVAREARAADLVIVSNVRENRNPFRVLDPGSLILKAGRPVLTVPSGVTSLSLRRIAIAWKDVREARRAVQDALPLLQKAESVLVVEVAEERGIEQASRLVADVARYLARHHVEVVAQRVRPAEVAEANSLLRLIEDENIDLIVAGGYGHSRLGEWAFGGVTRDLLAESPICCLFSH